MKIRIGKNPHRCEPQPAVLFRVSHIDDVQAFGTVQLTAVLDGGHGGRRLWLTLDRSDKGEALDALLEGLRELCGRGDITLRTAVMSAITQVMGAGSGVTQYEAGRVADLAVKLLRGES